MTVKERLILFLKYKEIGQKKFADTVGLSAGYVNAIRNSIQPATLDRISMHFPDLNTGWLLTGEGAMLKENRLEKMSGMLSLKDVVGEKPSEYTNYKEEVFRLREECNRKANRIIELMEEVERLRKENNNLKIR